MILSPVLPPLSPAAEPRVPRPEATAPDRSRAATLAPTEAPRLHLVRGLDTPSLDMRMVGDGDGLTTRPSQADRAYAAANLATSPRVENLMSLRA